MRLIVVTGATGSATAAVALATALAAAAGGQQTLLAGLNPDRGLGLLAGLPLRGEPQRLAPRVDAMVLDIHAEVTALWEQARSRLNGPPAALLADELPLVPGIDLYLLLGRLRALRDNGYTLAVIDAGTQEALLRTLTVPDGFRWLVRLLFGLDRGAGKSMASLGRAVLPTSILPSELFSPIQDARVELEQLREITTGPGQAIVRYVLRPDVTAPVEARIGVAALAVCGLACDGLMAGPLLPDQVADAHVAALSQAEREILATTAQDMAPRPILHFGHYTAGIQGMQTLAAQLYAGRDPLVLSPPIPPLASEYHGDPALAIRLPGLPKSELGLTISGDEIIVRIGPYRRHILLPEALRGQSSIRAAREGEWLVVRRR